MSDRTTTPNMENPDIRHAGTDIKFRVVLGVVVVFLVGMAVIHFVLAALWGAFAVRANATRTNATRTGAQAQAATVPPAPRLQAAPDEDEEFLRRRQWDQLHSYGWIDRKKGIVRIPVERALELEAKR